MLCPLGWAWGIPLLDTLSDDLVFWTRRTPLSVPAPMALLGKVHTAALLGRNQLPVPLPVWGPWEVPSPAVLLARSLGPTALGGGPVGWGLAY